MTVSTLQDSSHGPLIVQWCHYVCSAGAGWLT